MSSGLCSDPSPRNWGAAVPCSGDLPSNSTLYSREFWEETKRHLNPGGVVTVWMQLYEMSPDAVKSSMATFFEAFPDGVVFGNTFNGQGYDMVLVARNAGAVDPRANNDDIEGFRHVSNAFHDPLPFRQRTCPPATHLSNWTVTR